MIGMIVYGYKYEKMQKPTPLFVVEILVTMWHCGKPTGQPLKVPTQIG